MVEVVLVLLVLQTTTGIGLTAYEALEVDGHESICANFYFFLGIVPALITLNCYQVSRQIYIFDFQNFRFFWLIIL
jgi:hypothetical protein